MSLCHCSRCIFLTIDFLNFKRTEKTLSHSIVITAAFFAHTATDAMHIEQVDKIMTRVLATSVRMKNNPKWWLSMSHSHMHGIEYYIPFQRI